MRRFVFWLAAELRICVRRPVLRRNDCMFFSSASHHRPSVLSERSIDEIWRRLSIVQVRRRHTLTALGVFAVFISPFLASTWASGSTVHRGIEWLGLALIFAAFLGRSWCILYLGGHKGATLIQQGPYSISRNPLYLFSVTAVAGIGMQTGSIVFGLLLAMCVYGVFNYVIGQEEVLLRTVFGPQFESYCARVPRFWPRLSRWQSDKDLLIDIGGLWNTVRDALPYFLAVPVFEFIEYAQGCGWLPVLLHLP